MKKPGRMVAILAITVMLVLVSGTVALAAGPSGGRGGFGGDGTAAIAEKLGMTTDELHTALKAGKTIADLAEDEGVALADLKAAYDAARTSALTERIEQAVTDGELTRAQADWMLQGIKSGYGLGKGGGRLPFGRGLGSDDNPGLEAAAKTLGLTVDELKLQMWAGRTLADLAEKQGVELETVQSAISEARQAAMKEAIAQAVKDGKITQAQADWILEGIDKGYGLRPGGRNLPSGRGMPRGGFEGGTFGEPPDRGGQRGPAPLDDSAGAGFRAPSVPGATFDAA